MKRSAQANWITIIAAGAMLAAISPWNAPTSAFPMVTPRPSASATASPTPPPNLLPLDSTLTFVLDGTISSRSSKPDDMVPAHLSDALVLDGRTIAPAGAPVTIRILDAKRAENPDIYGFVDIYFGSLTLSDGKVLPLRAPIAHLNVNVSAGHASTVGVEDTIGDIFTPTLLFHVLRKGRDFTLEPGAKIHARTEATIRVAPNGAVAVITPPPLVLEAQIPHSSFNASPIATAPANPQLPLATPEATAAAPQPNSTP